MKSKMKPKSKKWNRLLPNQTIRIAMTSTNKKIDADHLELAIELGREELAEYVKLTEDELIKEVKERVKKDIKDVMKYARESAGDSMGFSLGKKEDFFENNFSMVEVNEAVERAS